MPETPRGGLGPGGQRERLLVSCLVAPFLAALLSLLFLGAGAVLSSLSWLQAGQPRGIGFQALLLPAVRLALILALLGTAWALVEAGGRTGRGGPPPRPPGSSG